MFILTNLLLKHLTQKRTRSRRFYWYQKNQADKVKTLEFSSEEGSTSGGKKNGEKEGVEKITTKEPEEKSGEIQKHVFRKIWDMFLGFFRKFL